MKRCFLILVLFKIMPDMAQPLPHGMVYGQKPNTLGLIPAAKLETYMAKRMRISITISGRVKRIIKAKDGWFVLDAGNGKEIEAHFINYGINIPESLKERNIIAEGIAQKQFAAADTLHFVSDKPGNPKHRITKPSPKLTFEVKGLIID